MAGAWTVDGVALKSAMKTNVYVDAFNLYYGCLKGTPHRWLDLGKLAGALLPTHAIQRVRYFTARVTPIAGKGDGQQPVRQQTYLRALSTLPTVTIHEGHYQAGKKRARLVSPPPGGPSTVLIHHMEEKGSDVNLATMLLVDAFRDDFEQALVISNDSDLALPIEMVNRELKKPVGVAFPCTLPGRKRSLKLQQVARFVRDIREPTLSACQFAVALRDAHGAITKPQRW